MSLPPQTLLDVLFTSNPDLFSSTGTSELTGSDHSMIYGECTAKLQKESKVYLVRHFKKRDSNQLILDLANAPWQVMDIFDHIDNKWSYWKSLFLNVVDSQIEKERFMHVTILG